MERELTASSGTKTLSSKSHAPWASYGVAVLGVAVVVLIRWLLDPWMGDHLPFITVFGAVAAAVWYGGWRPALAATVLGYLACNYLFIEPRSVLGIESARARIGLGLYLFTCSLIIGLGEMMRVAQRLAKERWELLRVTFTSIGDAVITTDTEGRVTSLNSAAESLVGWTNGEAAGRPLDEVFQILKDQTHQKAENPVGRVLAEGRVLPLANHTILIAKDGSKRLADGSASPIREAHGQVMGCVLVFRDITERKRAEERLRESEERFRLMANAAPVLIWSSGTDKLCTWFNKQWLKFVGRTMEQELGNGWAENVHPDDFDRCLKTYTAAFDKRLPFAMEYRLRRHDGEYRWVLDHGVPRQSPAGEFAGYIGSCIDLTDRKRAEEASRARETELEVIINQTPFMLTRCSRDLRYQFVSHAYAAMIGRKAEEIAGKPILEIMGEQGFKTILPHVEKALQGHRAEYESEVRFQGAGPRWLQVVYTPETNDEGEVNGWIGSILDISERKQAEEASRRSQERLHGIITSAMDAVISIDSQQRIVLLNPAAEKMFGVSAKETIGQGIDRLIPDRFRAIHATHVATFGQTGVSTRRMGALGAISGLRANGEEFPIEASISQVEVGGGKLFTVILRDITERKRTEEALRHAQQRLDLALKASGAVPWGWSVPENLLEEWTPEFRRLYGFQVEESPCFETWIARIHPADRARVIARTQQMLATVGDDVWNEEFRIIHPELGERWIGGLGRCIRGEAGSAVRMAGVNFDITERKRAEAALREAHEQLANRAIHLEKLVEQRTSRLNESIGDLEAFSYSIVHDMRAPLRSMQGYAKILSQDYEQNLDATALNYLRRIRVSGNRLDALITDVLSYSKITKQELELSPIEPGELIEQIADSYPHLQPAHLDLEVQGGPLPSVLANPAALTQVLSNLLGNAVKFVRPGLKPHVRVWAEILAGPTSDGALPEREQQPIPMPSTDLGALSIGPPLSRRDRPRAYAVVRLWFEDNGIGIPSESRERIFQMFQRLNSSEQYEGTGIGLAIVRKAIERMGGAVGVESEPGRGSRFWVELQKSPGVVA